MHLCSPQRQEPGCRPAPAPGLHHPRGCTSHGSPHICVSLSLCSLQVNFGLYIFVSLTLCPLQAMVSLQLCVSISLCSSLAMLGPYICVSLALCPSPFVLTDTWYTQDTQRMGKWDSPHLFCYIEENPQKHKALQNLVSDVTVVSKISFSSTKPIWW